MASHTFSEPYFSENAVRPRSAYFSSIVDPVLVRKASMDVVARRKLFNRVVQVIFAVCAVICLAGFARSVLDGPPKAAPAVSESKVDSDRVARTVDLTAAKNRVRRGPLKIRSAKAHLVVGGAMR